MFGRTDLLCCIRLTLCIMHGSLPFVQVQELGASHGEGDNAVRFSILRVRLLPLGVAVFPGGPWPRLIPIQTLRNFL